MALNAKKTEHCGAKHGGSGYWGHKKCAKTASKKARRQNDKKAEQGKEG